MDDLRSAHSGKVKYLSIDIEYRNDGSITLTQHAYTRELLEK